MAFAKPDPRAFAKMRQKRTDQRAVDRRKMKVRQFHRYRCCVCRRETMVVHEHLPRSLRGPVSLQNSFLACDTLDGGSCHPLLQQHKIHAFNTTAGPDQQTREFDATQSITFEMAKRYAEIVFADRPMPPYVRVVE